MVQCHPFLSGVQVANRCDGVLVELVGYWCKCWAGAYYAGWFICMYSGRFADGKSRVCIEFGDGVGPQCPVVVEAG